jgi:hypothetical protein
MYGDASRPEADLTFFAGTFCKHPLAMTAAQAVLDKMQTDGPDVQVGLAYRAQALTAELRPILGRSGLPLKIDQFSSLMYLDTSGAGEAGELLLKGLIYRGVYIWEGRTLFLSAAHTDQDLDDVRRAVAETLDELITRNVLPAAPALRPSNAVPLRDEQELLWLGAELASGSQAAYNEILTIPVTGQLRPDLVAEALSRLVQRHDALRLRIDTLARTQSPVADSDIPMETISLGGGKDRWLAGRQHVLRLLDTHFDLVGGPIVRAALLTSDCNETVMVLVFPHAVIDGWSISVLRRDFAAIYGALHRRHPDFLRQADSFAEFVRWEASQMAAVREAMGAYWRCQLDGVDARSVLFPGPRTGRSYLASFRRVPLGEDFPRRLAKLCAALSITPFVAGLTAWYAALSVATERSDLVVAAAIAGQPQCGRPDLVGYCLRILPLRTDTAGAKTFVALAGRVSTIVRDAMTHWFVSEAELIEHYWPGGDQARPPLGGAHFELETVDQSVALGDAPPLGLDLAEVTYTKWDISMVLVDQGESMTAQLVHNCDVVPDKVAAGLLDIYVGILRSACDDAAAPWAFPADAAGPRFRASRRELSSGP